MNPDTAPITNVDRSILAALVEHPSYMLGFALNLAIAIAAYLWMSSIGMSRPLNAIYLLIPSALIYARLAKRVRDDFMRQFAQSVGYDFSPAGDMSSVAGEIFKTGDSQHIFAVASGTDNGHPVRIFFFEYTIGAGKSRQTIHNTVFERGFSAELPHIMLRQKSFWGEDASIPFMSGMEELRMDGDFNNHFTLVIDKGFELEAYQIFTPDFMLELETAAKGFDFEFDKNKLYVYKPSFVNTSGDLRTMFDLANRLSERLEPTLTQMTGDVQAVEEAYAPKS